MGILGIGVAGENGRLLKSRGKDGSTMTPRLRKRIVECLVRVNLKGRRPGMGVFTPGDRILTAAHCLPKQPDPGKYALIDSLANRWVSVRCCNFGDPVVEFDLDVISVDPCNDIAVL